MLLCKAVFVELKRAAAPHTYVDDPTAVNPDIGTYCCIGTVLQIVQQLMPLPVSPLLKRRMWIVTWRYTQHCHKQIPILNDHNFSCTYSSSVPPGGEYILVYAIDHRSSFGTNNGGQYCDKESVFSIILCLWHYWMGWINIQLSPKRHPPLGGAPIGLKFRHLIVKGRPWNESAATRIRGVKLLHLLFTIRTSLGGGCGSEARAISSARAR